MYSLFDYAFGPTKVIVVSEERLQAAERRAKEEQIEAVEARIEDLTKYRNSLYEEIKRLAPPMKHDDLDALESNVTDSGVPGGNADV